MLNQFFSYLIFLGLIFSGTNAYSMAVCSETAVSNAKSTFSEVELPHDHIRVFFESIKANRVYKKLLSLCEYQRQTTEEKAHQEFERIMADVQVLEQRSSNTEGFGSTLYIWKCKNGQVANIMLDFKSYEERKQPRDFPFAGVIRTLGNFANEYDMVDESNSCISKNLKSQPEKDYSPIE